MCIRARHRFPAGRDLAQPFRRAGLCRPRHAGRAAHAERMAHASPRVRRAGAGQRADPRVVRGLGAPRQPARPTRHDDARRSRQLPSECEQWHPGRRPAAVQAFHDDHAEPDVRGSRRARAGRHRRGDHGRTRRLARAVGLHALARCELSDDGRRRHAREPVQADRERRQARARPAGRRDRLRRLGHPREPGRGRPAESQPEHLRCARRRVVAIARGAVCGPRGQRDGRPHGGGRAERVRTPRARERQPRHRPRQWQHDVPAWRTRAGWAAVRHVRRTRRRPAVPERRRRDHHRYAPRTRRSRHAPPRQCRPRARVPGLRLSRSARRDAR